MFMLSFLHIRYIVPFLLRLCIQSNVFVLLAKYIYNTVLRVILWRMQGFSSSPKTYKNADDSSSLSSFSI